MPALLIASAIAVCVAVAPRKEPTVCDPGVAARRAWFTRTPSDGRSPSDEGFQIVGACATTLIHREFSCKEASVRSFSADNPYLKEALALGFVTYTCETPSDSRVEFSMRSLVGS